MLRKLDQVKALIMKLYDGGTTVLIVIVVAGLVGFLSSRWLGDDNSVEECAEAVIKHHTGMDFDLTPESEEEKTLDRHYKSREDSIKN